MASQNVLVVVAHPDDEVLGAGGTVCKLTQHGYRATTVILAKGRQQTPSLHESALDANQRLGIQDVVFLDGENLELESVPLHRLAAQVEALLVRYQPATVFTHHYGDLNRDHQVTFEAVLTAARPLPTVAPVEIICCEIASSTEWTQWTTDKMFKPNFYVDISNSIQAKLEALHCYDREMRAFPHPRSYEGLTYLARVRGMTVGLAYAEAFEVVRSVWP